MGKRCGAHLRAERDAYYARLYGLSRDELRACGVLDPQEVYGSDFPWGGETFRVLTKPLSFRFVSCHIPFGAWEGERVISQNRDTLATQNLLIAGSHPMIK